MNVPFSPDTADIERMLHDRTLTVPPPALRSRVLAAVADAIDDHRPARRVKPADGFAWLPGGVLLATALSLLLVMMLSREAASHRTGSATERPLISFAERAAAAGITLESGPPSAVRLAGVQPYDPAIPSSPDTLQSLDARGFLQGDL